MKISKEAFDNLMFQLKGSEMFTYDSNARLFCGGKETQYPEFREPLLDERGREAGESAYIMYATVKGRTLPLEHGIDSSMIDQSRAMKPPAGSNMPCAYASGVGSHFDKALEVLALEIPGKGEKRRPKWNVLLLRDAGEPDGYINDEVAEFLSRREFS